MSDVVTKTIEQLTPAANAATTDLIAVQRPGGPVQHIPIAFLSGVSGPPADTTLLNAATLAATNAAGAAAADRALVATALASILATLTAENTFATRAAADAAIAEVAANDYIQVLVDETRSSHRVIYRKVGGAYVFALDASIFVGLTEILFTRVQLPPTGGGSFIRRIPQMPVPLTNGVDGRDDTFEWNEALASTAFGSGAHKYYTDSYRWGMNVAVNGTPRDPFKPSTYVFWESKFTQDPTVHEYHSEPHLLTHNTRTSPFRDHRVLDFYLPWDGDDHTTAAHGAIRVNQVYFADWDDNIKFFFDFSDPLLSKTVHNAVDHVNIFSQNNVPYASMQNAAGTLDLAMPFLDDADHLAIRQPLKAFFTLAGESVSELENLTGGAKNILQISANANDAILTLSNNGAGVHYSLGIDVSEDNAFKLEASYRALGAATALIKATSSFIIFGIPIVLPSSTVAGLGSAAQAGAQKFCTNEAGGAVPVFADGTNWRRVTDRALAV